MGSPSSDDRADQHGDDGDDHRHDRPADEERRHHVSPAGQGAGGGGATDSSGAGCGFTAAPSLTFWTPSTTIRSPALTPGGDDPQLPGVDGPTSTRRSCTLSSGPTTATE